MRICFINDETVGHYMQALSKPCLEDEGTDVAVFSFAGLGEVAYEKELRGETVAFEEIASLSKRLQGVVVSGCITSTRGHKRKSAVVAENGKLIGYLPQAFVTEFDGSTPETEKHALDSAPADTDMIWRLAYLICGFLAICILSDYLILRKDSNNSDDSQPED
jgi:hypothetical protein